MPRAAPARPRARRRRDGRHRLPRNAVIDALAAAGGPSRVVAELGVSLATLARWRKAGMIHTAADALGLAALARVGAGATAQLLLARELAGIRPGPARPRTRKR